MCDTETKPLDRLVDFACEATRIFRGAHMARDVKKFLFALAAVIVWALGALLINVLMGKSWIILVAAGIAAIVLIVVVFSYSQSELTRASIALLVASILTVAAVVTVLIMVTRDLGRSDKAFIFHPLWALAVASFFGTAIARIAAVWAATEDSVGLRDAARFALGKLATSIWTLLIPAAALLAFAIFLVCIGVPGRIPVAGHVWYVIIGITYIIWLLGGICFALVLVTYLPGLTLFQPAIAAEGEDAFGAFSNVYRFVLQKPWHLAFYGALAYAYSRVVLSVAALVIIYAGKITNTPLGWGIGKKMGEHASKLDLGEVFAGSFLSLRGPGIAAFDHVLSGEVHRSFEGVSIGGWFIVFWQYVLLAFFMAFTLTLFYCVATQVYFLMRKAADGTPFAEVYTQEPEEEQFAAEFPETPKPAETRKPVLEDLPDKAAERVKAEPDEKYKPIDLAGSGESPEDSEDPGR